MMDKMKEEVVELSDFETKMVVSNQFEDIYVKQENESIDYASPIIKLEPQDIGEEVMGALVVKCENEISVCEHQHMIKSHSLILDKDPGVWCKNCSIISEFEENKLTLKNNDYNLLKRNFNKSEEKKCCIESNELFCTIPKSEEKCHILFCGPLESEEHECVLENPLVCTESLAEGHMQINSLQCDLCKMTFSMQSSELDSPKNTLNNKKRKKVNNNENDDVLKSVVEKVPFRCQSCNFLFCNTLESKELVCATDNVKGRFSPKADKEIPEFDCLLFCGLCNLSLNSQTELDTHRKTHNLDSDDTMDNLPMTSGSDNVEDNLSEFDECVNKLKTSEETEENIVCNRCNISFDSKMELDLHMETHKIFSCAICEKKYTYKCNLATHMVSHTGDKPFQCKRCGKTFSCSSYLVSHMRKYTGERPYCCEVCNKSFSRKQTLTHHMLIHTGEKPFQCDTCCKNFLSKRALFKHIQIHFGARPFHCEMCKSSFASKESLRAHFRIHTGDRPFICPICNKCFAYRSGLSAHKLIHTVNQPYHCFVCSVAFSQQSKLLAHMYVHAEDRPFICIVCKKGFRRKDALKRHSVTHTDDRPYECIVCNKGFRFKQNLMRHMHIHSEVSSLPNNLTLPVK